MKNQATQVEAKYIRIHQYPFSVEIDETTDLTDILAPSNIIARVEIGVDESRHHALARAFLVASSTLLNREIKL